MASAPIGRNAGKAGGASRSPSIAANQCEVGPSKVQIGSDLGNRSRRRRTGRVDQRCGSVGLAANQREVGIDQIEQRGRVGRHPHLSCQRDRVAGVVVAAQGDQCCGSPDSQLITHRTHASDCQAIQFGGSRLLDIGGPTGSPQHVHAVARQTSFRCAVAGSRRGVDSGVEVLNRGVDVTDDRVSQTGGTERRRAGRRIADGRRFVDRRGGADGRTRRVVEHASQGIDHQRVHVLAARWRVDAQRSIQLFIGPRQPCLGPSSIPQHPHADRLGRGAALEARQQAFTQAVGILAVARGERQFPGTSAQPEQRARAAQFDRAAESNRGGCDRQVAFGFDSSELPCARGIGVTPCVFPTARDRRRR
jgi:hypothetical protein